MAAQVRHAALSRDVTMGKPVVMGRKTYLVDRQAAAGPHQYRGQPRPRLRRPGVAVAPSLAAALDAARGDALRRGADAIAVIGGAEIYAQTMADGRPAGDYAGACATRRATRCSRPSIRRCGARSARTEHPAGARRAARLCDRRLRAAHDRRGSNRRTELNDSPNVSARRPLRPAARVVTDWRLPYNRAEIDTACRAGRAYEEMSRCRGAIRAAGPGVRGARGPWGSGPQSSGPTPPDLEELLRRSQDKLRTRAAGRQSRRQGHRACIAARRGRDLGLLRLLPRRAGRARRRAAVRQSTCAMQSRASTITCPIRSRRC